jgi:ribose 1,5-bisphosphokinase
LPRFSSGTVSTRGAVPKRRRPSPGLLLLVAGPSGAGKDTLIAAAKRKFRDNPVIVFPQRTITRPEGIGEDHVPASRRAFARLEDAGGFFLSWTAHGHHYGVPIEAERDLRAGRIVIVNVSRGIVTEACARWPRTRIIHVTVALDALRARLEARGREAGRDIDKRVSRATRADPLPGPLTDTIDNSGRQGSAVRRFNALIAAYAEASAKR